MNRAIAGTKPPPVPVPLTAINGSWAAAGATDTVPAATNANTAANSNTTSRLTPAKQSRLRRNTEQFWAAFLPDLSARWLSHLLVGFSAVAVVARKDGLAGFLVAALLTDVVHEALDAPLANVLTEVGI